MPTKLILIFLFIIVFCVDCYAQQSGRSKRVQTIEINAPSLGCKKQIWVYLPIGYDTTTQKYPVIYMHDGQNLFDSTTSYAGEWQIDETLDLLAAKTIVIGIEHGGSKRLEELTPFANEKYGGGKADLYLEFVVKTLKPFVDTTFRTKKSAKNTAIFGSSLGGLVSFYAVLRYPKVFGKAGVFSPSFWFSDKIYQMMAAAPKSKAKIYMMCGDNEDAEMVPDLERMYKMLDKNRCYCLELSQKKIIAGGKHNEQLWREQFGEAYQWLF